jgi:hypothetical protein
MRYSDREYLSKFLIDPEFEDSASHEDWEEPVATEFLANDDVMSTEDDYWDDTTDRG